MAAPRVTHLRSVALDVANLDQSLKFYTDVWGLEPVASEADAVYLRGTGDEHHLVALHQAERPGLRSVGLGATSTEMVDALHARAVALGGLSIAAPAPLDENAGGGYGCIVRTPSGGHPLKISSNVRRHETLQADRSKPERMSHVALDSPDDDADGRFCMEALGFRNSDQSALIGYFLRCSSDHHSIAMGKRPRPMFNHVAFEFGCFDGMMRGVGRVHNSGTLVEWGVGRHGPGNNIFAYFFDPNGFVVEYSSEFDQVDDATHVPNTPDYWSRLIGGKPERWGMARPSQRLLEYWSGTAVGGAERLFAPATAPAA